MDTTLIITITILILVFCWSLSDLIKGSQTPRGTPNTIFTNCLDVFIMMFSTSIICLMVYERVKYYGFI